MRLLCLLVLVMGITANECEAPPSFADDIFLEGGMSSYWSDGKFIFDIDAAKSEKEDGTRYGQVVEDVWADTETLTWKSPSGARIAVFERVKSKGYFGGTSTRKDFSNIKVKGWEKGDDCSEGQDLYLIQYMEGDGIFSGKSWFGRDPGSYKILSLKDVKNGGTTTLSVTSESNTYPGGGSHYEMKLFEQKMEPPLPAGCRDTNPAYCFEVAVQGLCTSTPVILKGMRPGEACMKEDYTKNCCKMSCGQDIGVCQADALLEDDPIAILTAKRDSKKAKQQSWQAHINDHNKISADPRVLVALMKMKSAGLKRDSDEKKKKREESYGVSRRMTNYIFGNQLNYWGFLVLMAVLAGLFHVITSRYS